MYVISNLTWINKKVSDDGAINVQEEGTFSPFPQEAGPYKNGKYKVSLMKRRFTDMPHFCCTNLQTKLYCDIGTDAILNSYSFSRVQNESGT